MNLFCLPRTARLRHNPRAHVGLVMLVALVAPVLPLSAGCHRTTASEDAKPRVMKSGVRSRRGGAMYSTAPAGGARQGGQTAP